MKSVAHAAVLAECQDNERLQPLVGEIAWGRELKYLTPKPELAKFMGFKPYAGRVRLNRKNLKNILYPDWIATVFRMKYDKPHGSG